MQANIPVRFSIIAVLVASLWSATAVAGEGDLLTLSAAAGYSYDTNVFRINSAYRPAGQGSPR